MKQNKTMNLNLRAVITWVSAHGFEMRVVDTDHLMWRTNYQTALYDAINDSIAWLPYEEFTNH